MMENGNDGRDAPLGRLEKAKRLEDVIIELPGKPPCMLDRDLARVYGVKTRALNQARERNPKKFTEGIDYFVLSRGELEEVAICDHLGEADKFRLSRGESETITNCNSVRYGPSKFYAYTKRGAHMFATILNTDEAIERAVVVVEGFCTFSLLMDEIKAGRVTVKATARQEDVGGEHRCKALCFKGRHLHLLNFGKYGEVAIVKEVAAALGLHKGGLRDKARAYPEVGGSIAVLKGEAFTLFKAACKPAGIRLKSKSIAICPIERLSNLLLYGRTDKAELELYRLVNGYLMGTQPAVELTPYRRTAQGQLLNNN